VTDRRSQTADLMDIAVSRESADRHFVHLFLFHDVDLVFPLSLTTLLKTLDDFLVFHGFPPLGATLFQQLVGFVQILSDLTGFEIKTKNVFLPSLNFKSIESFKVGNLFAGLVRVPGIRLQFILEVADDGLRLFHGGFRGRHVGLSHFDETFDAFQPAPRLVHETLFRESEKPITGGSHIRWVFGPLLEERIDGIDAFDGEIDSGI
jgi:hypothetical protein